MTMQPDDVAALLQERKKHQEQWVQEAILLRDLFNGDIDVPLPEMERNEKAAVANVAVLGLNQMANRVASTQPKVEYPPVRPGINASEQLARKRELVNYSWWHMNNMKMLDRKRARWMLGYGMAPIQITTDTKLKIPKWQLRDPLTTYAAPAEYQDSLTPQDCIFTYYKSFGWLRQTYPDGALRVQRANQNRSNQPLRDSELFDVAEYVDDQERVLVLLGPRKRPYDDTPYQTNTNQPVLLERVDNRTGICPVVTPRRIAIDRPRSQYADNIGMYIMRAKLMALEYINAEKNVFAERWFLDDGQGEKVVDADGRRGIVGHVRGGKIQDLYTNPSINASQIMDRIERDERISGSIPAEFGGESSSNVRTGRRGDSIMSAAVDFTVQEIQEIFETSKEHENKIAVRTDKAYFSFPKSYYVGWGRVKNKKVDYDPKTTWEMDENFVAYSHAGTDINSLVVSGGQRIAQGTMSKRSFLFIDPLVEDPEFEHDQIIKEQLEQSILAELLQPGAISLVDKNRIMQLVSSNKMELADAIQQVQKEAQDRQASVGDPDSAAEGAEPGTPEAQPGLQPDQSAMQPGVAVAGPNPSQDNLSTLLNSLRRPQRMGASGA